MVSGKQKNPAPAKPTDYAAEESEDPIAEALSRFWVFIKQAIRSANPGERLGFVSNVAVFIVGSAAASIYGCQLSEMKRATIATQIAATAAKDAVEATKEQTRISNRPFVGISDTSQAIKTSPVIFGQQFNEGNITYYISLKDFGASPAQDLNGRASLMITDDSGEIEEELAYVCKTNNTGNKGMIKGLMIFPGANMVIISGDGFASQSRRTSHNPDGAVGIWLVGCILYKDQIGNSYYTKFLLQMIGNDRKPIRIKPRPGMTIAGEFKQFFEKDESANR